MELALAPIIKIMPSWNNDNHRTTSAQVGDRAPSSCRGQARPSTSRSGSSARFADAHRFVRHDDRDRLDTIRSRNPARQPVTTADDEGSHSRKMQGHGRYLRPTTTTVPKSLGFWVRPPGGPPFALVTALLRAIYQDRRVVEEAREGLAQRVADQPVYPGVVANLPPYPPNVGWITPATRGVGEPWLHFGGAVGGDGV
jgi:hypothetical protein